MEQRRCGRVAGIGSLVAVAVVCGVLVISAWGQLTLSTGAGLASQSLGSGTPFTPTTAVAPHPSLTCTVSVNGENVSNNAVQTAIDSARAGSTICLGPGTYPEQLNISKPLTLVGAGNSSTVIAPIAPLVANTVDFDSGTVYASLTPAAAIILVANTTGVTIENLQVNGSAATATFTGCGEDYYGVDFQNAGGTLTGSVVSDIELPPALFGCQPGLGVYAYNGFFFTGKPASPTVAVTVTNSTIVRYDKGGIVCDDAGEVCTIASNTVAGVGANTSIAQNGIQVGFGASAVVTDNLVLGNHYTGPLAPLAGDYFEPGYASAGILVFDAGSTVQVAGNVLRGNDLGIAVVATPTASVGSNSIEQGYDYGITFDLNASLAYVGYPIYSSATPWSSTASYNVITNVNVGILVYDDNVTVTGGTMTAVNVSVESLTDDGSSSYAIAVDYLSATSNVSGALLGNISSFQASAAFVPRAIGTYALYGDNFTANPAAPPTRVADGVVFDAASVVVERCAVNGFVVGLYVNPTVLLATISYTQVTGTARLGGPVWGIWAGNLVYPVSEDSATLLLTDNTVIGPGGGTGSALAGGSGIIAGGMSVTITGNTISDFSAVLGSGGYSGYDWWEGTQSTGLLVGCPPAATACVVEGNTFYDNSIGVAVLLTNATFSGAYATGPVTIAHNLFNDNGGYGLFTEMVWAGGPRPTSYIDNNTFNDTLTGAPAMVLSGQPFDVTNNVLVGTSASGNQGPSQGQGGGPLLSTASIEATDYWTTGYDTVTLNANLFLQTSVFWSSTFSAGLGSTLSGGELVTFQESGLPAGTYWSATVDGTTGAVPAPQAIIADLQNGSSPYPFSVPSVESYLPTPAAGTVTVSGAPQTVSIVFKAVTFAVTFTETGLPSGLTWYLNLSNGQRFHTANTSLTFAEPNGSYSYMFGGSLLFPRYYSALPGSFAVVGQAVQISAAFSQARQVVLTEKNLPSGMMWWANFTGNYSFHSMNATMVFYLTAGTWTFTVQAANHDYTAKGHRFTVHNPLASPHKAVSYTERFKLWKFPTTFTETGLPGGSHWCVVVTGGGTFCSAGTTVTFSEPNGTYSYTLTTTAAGFSGAGGGFTVHGRTSVAVTFTDPPALPASHR